MKRALVVCALVTAAVAASTPARAATVDRAFFTGRTSSLEVSSTEGCIESLTAARGADGAAWWNSSAVVLISRHDTCARENVVLIFGETHLSPDAYVVARDLSRATLSATVDGTDLLTGDPVTVSIDLSWTATGDGAHVSERNVSATHGATLIEEIGGVSRPADARGTISAGGTTYFSGTSPSSIDRLNFLEVTVTR